jgi:chromosome segregation ATPase
MPQNVAQWLAEIQSLQRQVAQLEQEREQAYASVDNWRKLYEAEAQQRRRDTAAQSAKITRLQQAITEFEAPQKVNSIQFDAEVSRIQSNQSVGQLQVQLIAARKQCEQLKQLLQAEQSEHAQTRESLTAALGDAVDLLAKERPRSSGE